MRHLIPISVGLPIAGVVGFALGNLQLPFVWLAALACASTIALGLGALVVTMLWFDPASVPARKR